MILIFLVLVLHFQPDGAVYPRIARSGRVSVGALPTVSAPLVVFEGLEPRVEVRPVCQQSAGVDEP